MITIPKFIDNCYKAIKEKHPDYEDEKIYAICWAQYNKLKEKKGKGEDLKWNKDNLSEIEYEIYLAEYQKLIE